MNDRKLHVIKKSHQLFIDKGFQATSIQDILDYSGISKGTFYNYFSSKNELLIALIKTLYGNMEKERDELLIGNDPSNIEIFIKQVELQLKTNRANRLVSFFEEAYFSNDEELKQFIKNGHLKMIHWLYHRFIDIFGENKKLYLLDLSIMFTGILQHNLKYNSLVHDSNKASINEIVRYSVNRLRKMVEEVTESKEQLLPPEWLENSFNQSKEMEQEFQDQLHQTVLMLKKALTKNDEQTKYIELLDFIQDELTSETRPRKFLIDSAILSLKVAEAPFDKSEFDKLEQLIANSTSSL